ncbi:MAG: biotin/lipoyl-binding protein [Chloroflexi bacterium]|nr:biotin/lipoyl-binding protein [Chloroflexota bacterium]
MKFNLGHNDRVHSLDLTPVGGSYLVVSADRSAEVKVVSVSDGRLELLMDGERVIAHISVDNARYWVTIKGRTFALTQSSGARKGGGAHHHAAGELTAPMPGQVRAVNVSEGDAVTKGQTLLILEAMKMEIRIQAPMDGIVKKLLVKQGETVEREQMLVEIVDRLES